MMMMMMRQIIPTGPTRTQTRRPHCRISQRVGADAVANHVNRPTTATAEESGIASHPRLARILSPFPPSPPRQGLAWILNCCWFDWTASLSAPEPQPKPPISARRVGVTTRATVGARVVPCFQMLLGSTALGCHLIPPRKPLDNDKIRIPSCNCRQGFTGISSTYVL